MIRSPMLAKREFAANPLNVVELSVLVAMTLLAVIASDGRAFSADPPPVALEPISVLAVRYTLETPGGGEIFPALASSFPNQYWPVATLTMVNTSSLPLVERVSAEICGWSRQSAQSVNLAPHETRTLQLNPELLPQTFENGEIRLATLEVRANVPGASVGYDETRPVYLHAASDFFWGAGFANAQFIARWVTPHDPAVLRLGSLARRYVPRGRLAG